MFKGPGRLSGANPPFFVIAGLDPAIQRHRQGKASPECSVSLDSRLKAENDGFEFHAFTASREATRS